MGSILVCYTLSEAKEHAATADGQRGEGQSWHQCHVTRRREDARVPSAPVPFKIISFISFTLGGSLPVLVPVRASPVPSVVRGSFVVKFLL